MVKFTMFWLFLILEHPFEMERVLNSIGIWHAIIKMNEKVEHEHVWGPSWLVALAIKLYIVRCDTGYTLYKLNLRLSIKLQ